MRGLVLLLACVLVALVVPADGFFRIGQSGLQLFQASFFSETEHLLVNLQMIGIDAFADEDVAEFVERAIGGDVVLVGLVPRNVHVSGIPLIVIGRDRIRPPVEIDAELGIVKP